MTIESHNHEPQAIGEILGNLDDVLATEPDQARQHQVERTDVLDEVAFLESERDTIAASIRGGNKDPNLRKHLDDLNQALLDAQADEIETRDTPGGNQGYE